MILLGFTGREAMLEALAALRQAGLAAESYSALAAEQDHPSPLPALMLAAGLLGAAGAMALQVYGSGWAYPLDIGGRPDAFWPAYVPFAFESGVLCAVATGLFGYIAAAGLPRLYHPADESTAFRAAMRDGWFVTVPHAPAALLERLNPALVEELAE